jgi:recombinational DNA repair protein RecT
MLQKIETQDTQAKFIALYKTVNKVSDEDAKNYFEVEKFSFLKMVQDDANLSKCSELSQMACFMEVINNGLSFDKTAKHVYLTPRNVKIGENQWETRMYWQMQADGLIYLTMKAGSIKHCSKPIIVFKGDTIKVGAESIIYEKMIPQSSNEIVGGFAIVTLLDGNKNYFWMDISEMARLAKYSAKANAKTGANALYSSGENGQPDLGFMQTKIVLRALKNYSKKKISTQQLYDDEEENKKELQESIEQELVSQHELPEGVMADEEGIELAF